MIVRRGVESNDIGSDGSLKDFAVHVSADAVDIEADCLGVRGDGPASWRSRGTSDRSGE